MTDDLIELVVVVLEAEKLPMGSLSRHTSPVSAMLKFSGYKRNQHSFRVSGYVLSVFAVQERKRERGKLGKKGKERRSLLLLGCYSVTVLLLIFSSSILTKID